MILVTGGTGLLGSHLLFELASTGQKVRAIKRNGANVAEVERIFSFYSTNFKQLFEHIEWVDADVTDIYSLEDSLKGIDRVYHCAAIVSLNPADQGKMMKINVEGTANIVNACLKKEVAKLCHVSSIAALGSTRDNEDEITEDVFWKNAPENSNYSISKYGAEREVWRGMEEGLKAIIVNPAVIIGPTVRRTGSADMIAAAYKGLKFYTEGTTGFVDVRDTARIMISLMEADITNQRFIISSENISYRQFYTIAQKFFNKPAPVIGCGYGMTELAWRYEKLRTLLGGHPPRMTKEIARASHKKNKYSNKKVIAFTGHEFMSVEKSIEQACSHYLKNLKRD